MNLTDKQLSDLKTSIKNLNEIKHKIGQLCFTKEQEIRKINDNFEKIYAELTSDLKKIEETQSALVDSFDQEYGKGVQKAYDLTNGEIKDIESN